jgi:signal transduction histidine kinase
MFKECIHNVSRHSGCTSVKAELEVVEGEILLSVADNGRGLKPTEESAGLRGGNGIPGMRRRAEILGGSVQIVSNPGEGCTVCMRIPLRRSSFAQFRV